MDFMISLTITAGMLSFTLQKTKISKSYNENNWEIIHFKSIVLLELEPLLSILRGSVFMKFLNATSNCQWLHRV